MAMKSVLVVLGVLLFPPSGVLAQPATSAEPPDVPADVEEWMRTAWGMEPQVLGVTVSARAPGRNVTTSVFTDSDGEYHFPPLETGRPYKVWAQAQAFEAGRAEVALSEAGARQNFTLTPAADFHNQLTGSQWYAALPDGTREDLRMKEVFRAACMGCHPPNFTLISRFDEAGWRNIIDVMSRMHPYRYGTPAAAARRQPNAIMVHFRDELAAWLAKARGPGPSPMTFTPRRPTGDSTLMIAREYDAPEPGFGLPFFNDGSTDWALGPVDFMDESKHHAMNATLDADGNVWMADMFNITRTVVRYDWRTGHATNFVLSETPDAPPANSHDIIRDAAGVVWFDGMVWLPFTHGDSIAKFDPGTEEWTSYSLPTIGTKTHGLQAVTVNGRTQIGMGYLGAGKVAKLEFRPREELQRLKAETRP